MNIFKKIVLPVGLSATLIAPNYILSNDKKIKTIDWNSSPADTILVDSDFSCSVAQGLETRNIEWPVDSIVVYNRDRNPDNTVKKLINRDYVQDGWSLLIPQELLKLEEDTTAKISTSKEIQKQTAKIEKIYSPINFFIQNSDTTISKFLKQAGYISGLSEKLNSLYISTGSDTTLKDDKTEQMEKSINGINENIKNLSEGILYKGIKDSLSNLLDKKEKFTKNYSKLIESTKEELAQITNLEELLRINESINQQLRDSTKTLELKALDFKEYEISFDSLKLDREEVSKEIKEIKIFQNYLSNLKEKKRELFETRMASEVIDYLNGNLEAINKFYQDKKGILDKARQKTNIPDRKLVNKEIKEINKLSKKINEYIEYTPKKTQIRLPNLTPITFVNGVEVGAFYSPGIEGQLLQKDIDGLTPMVGLKLVNFGDLSLIVGYGQKTWTDEGIEESYSQPDPVTGITGHSEDNWYDWGSFQVGDLDVSIPLSKNLALNFGALGTSEDHKPSGTVDEYIIVPGINDPIFQNSYYHAPEAFVGNKIYGTLGLQGNLGKFDAKAKIVLGKHEKPNYQFTIGYNIRRK